MLSAAHKISSPRSSQPIPSVLFATELIYAINYTSFSISLSI